jgi:hypothetical protein
MVPSAFSALLPNDRPFQLGLLPTDWEKRIKLKRQLLPVQLKYLQCTSIISRPEEF